MGKDELTMNGRIDGQLCSKAQNQTLYSWQLAFDFASICPKLKKGEEASIQT